MSSLLTGTKAAADVNVDKGNGHHSSRENELQIPSSSAFKLPDRALKLPDGWLVEERPRVYNPSIVDRYYHEPKTRRKFRSLIAVRRHLQEKSTGHRYLQEEARDCQTTKRRISQNKEEKARDCQTTKRLISQNKAAVQEESAVQRYLQEEARDYQTTKRLMTQNKDANYTKSGTGQRYHSVRAYERCLPGENASASTPKLVLKFVTGKQSANGDVPIKTDSQKKVNFGDEETVHNLARPPAKVRWVLSGPGGHWRPFLGDCMIPESEKRKWSDAFVQAIHEGYGR